MQAVQPRGRILEALVVSMCALITALLFIIFASTYAPSIESRLMPPVREFTVSSLKRVSDKEIVISGTMVKLRSECRLDSIVAYTTDRQRTTKSLAKVDFQGLEEGPNMTFRVTGKQTWGPWGVKTERRSVGEYLVLTSFHECHNLYLIPTKLIEITLPQQ